MTYADLSMLSLIITVAVAILGILVMWFVIFTAVRAALRSHQYRLEAEQRPYRG